MKPKKNDQIPEKMRITRLEGPDRVRKRPAVIYGSADAEGAQQMVWKLLCIFATEAQLGHCKHLSVAHNGARVVISADDRGICLGQDSGDDTAWKKLFDDFGCSSAVGEMEKEYSFSICSSGHHLLYGDPVGQCVPEDMDCFELYCARCVCKTMDVSSVRKGIKSTLRFESGNVVGGITNQPTEEPAGTTFCFELDPQVFTQTEISRTYFLDVLDRFALLCPGLNCLYINEADGKRIEFAYPNGISDRVKAQKEQVYYKCIRAKARERYNSAEYEACLEVTIGPALHCGSAVCYHNFKELTYGGTHYRQMQQRVCRLFNDCFHWRIAENREKDEEITFEELSKHLCMVLVSWCPSRFSRWENGARLSIENRVLEDMAYDVVSTGFRNYLYNNKEALLPVVDAIIRQRKKQK